MYWNWTHFPRRLVALFVLALPFSGSSGCTILVGGATLGAAGGAIASRDIRVRPGVSVRVEFTNLQDIPVVVQREADTTWLRRTEYLVGRIDRVRGDTLWIDLSESRTAMSRMRYGRRQAQAPVDQRDPGASIVLLANRPTYVVAGAALGTAVSGGIVVIYCLFRPCM